MAERFVNERLVMWQQRLMLTGWKIWILMSPASGLKPNTLGNIQWDVDDKSATIRVLRASEYALPCREMLADMEFTVVHELIHLELSYLPRKEADRSIEESAVNQITKALLSLDRRK